MTDAIALSEAEWVPWVGAVALLMGALSETSAKPALIQRAADGRIRSSCERLSIWRRGTGKMETFSWPQPPQMEPILHGLLYGLQNRIRAPLNLAGDAEWFSSNGTRIVVSGLKLERCGVEAFLASFLPATANETAAQQEQPLPSPPLPRRRRGAPARWDWAGAISALSDHDALNDSIADVARELTPQSSLEAFVAQWFSDRADGLSPSPSLIRNHVGRVVQARKESLAAQADKSR